MEKSKNIKKQQELDFTSSHFNALRILKEPRENVRIPRPNAPIYDNLSSFVVTEDGIFPKERKSQEISRKMIKHSVSSETADQNEQVKATTTRKMKSSKNVLTRMDNTVQGPLCFLKKCMDEKLRIQVYTRGAVTVRGFCIGFVEAFDRHWNLVLKDVFETWIRKRKHKMRNFRPVRTVNTDTVIHEKIDKSNEDVEGEKEEGEYEEESITLWSRGYALHKTAIQEDHKTLIDENRKSKTVVRKTLKRKEICERHVDQMLIRGEQIVIVTLQPS